MSRKEKTLQLLQEQKILPLFYHEDSDTSIRISRALYDAGIRAIEYTNRGEFAFRNFCALQKEAEKNMPGLLLGVGTVKNAKTANKYLDADADFIVSPIISKPLAKAMRKTLWIPGCMTPSEIAVAEEHDVQLVKLFPGSLLGPGFVGAVTELFPGMRFMPTGIGEADENNLRAWFAAGVTAVGLGSKLISKELVNARDFDAIRDKTAGLLHLVRNLTF